MTSQQALMVLNAIPGLGASGIKKLMAVFGNANQILQKNYEELLEQGLASSLVTNIVHFPKDKFLEGEYNHLRQKGAQVITIVDEDYPSCLKEIPSAPIVLYIRGKRQMLSSLGIAMVGSRQASFYGMKMAESFARAFAQAGITVISGLARGIDTASHQGCLKAQGATMAVLGCGLNHIYPKENALLLEDIAAKGLLVSEFPMDTAPLMYNFPRRNRIISGLSLATVIIEASPKSGALITADCALEQGRDVFAVPGNIDSVLSEGTNRLIKDGAKIALSAQEVLEELGLEIQAQLEQGKSQEKPRVNLSVEEYKVYEVIDHQPNHIDIIATRCGQEIGLLMSQMLNLELKGVIKQLPGQYYIRV